MGPLPALMIDYDTGIKKKASPVKYYWHRNQSVAEAAVWFQWGGGGGPTSLLSFWISTPCNILLGT